MHTQESRNHTVTKFAAFVHVVYDTMCKNFIVKKIKIPINPRLRTRAWPPSVLILRGLWS